MPNLEVQPGWPAARQLDRDEFASGGPNGNLNEHAKVFLARTEYLQQQKANKSEIVQGVFEFGTYAEFNAIKSTLPLNCTVVIGEENTTGTGSWGVGNNRWNGSILKKSSFDPILKSEEFIYSALTNVDYTGFVQGTYVRADGTTASNASFACTDFINVIEGQQYTIFTSLISTAPIVWYDKNKILISIDYVNQTTLSEYTYTAPVGAKYVRVNFGGNAATTKPYLKSKMYNLKKLDSWFNQYQLPVVNSIVNSAIDTLTTNVDYTGFVQGTYVRADGTTASNASFACTDFINVIEGQQYTIFTSLISTAPIVWYDKNKILISIDYVNQTTLSEYTYTAPVGAKYVRVNFGGNAATTKPYLKSKVIKTNSLDAWFNQYQKPTVATMITDAIQNQSGTSTLGISNSIIDSLILQGQAPYWVKRAEDGSAAILDFDCDNNRYFYRGNEYSTLSTAIAAVGGLSKIIDPSTKAFVLHGNYADNAINLVASADASSNDFDVSKFDTVDTTVSKSNNALALSKNNGTTGSTATISFPVKANKTYLIKSANKTGLQGVRLSILDSSNVTKLSIGSWNTAIEEVREFIGGATDDIYKLKFEIPGNGATSYLSYCKIFESVAFAGLNCNGFTLVADFTPENTSVNETYLQVGQSASRANYVNHIATVRGQNSNSYPTVSNMLNRNGSYVTYIPNSGTGDNIAQIGEKSTFAMSVGGGFVSFSSGYKTRLHNVDHSIFSLMNSAMISVGCSGPSGGQKATALLNRFTVFSKSFKDPARSVELFTSQQSKLLLLGDSFATPELSNLIQIESGIKTLRDGVGGSSLRQQANRLEAEPKLWDCTLIIMDGGFEFKEKYGQGYLDAIERMITCLEAAGHSRYYYVQPSPGGYDDYSIGTARRASWDEGQAEIAKLVGVSRYIPTLQAMQAFGSGSASDNLLVSKGLMPANLRADDIHENTLGSTHRAKIISNFISTNPLN